MTYHTHFDSPVGSLLLLSDGRALTGLYMNEKIIPQGSVENPDAAPFATVKAQLKEYFAGERTDFDVPLSPLGTTFQRVVWAHLRDIPYGSTISYGELAKRIRSPKACRAVGLANGKNPISIIVPCHRVIGANGKLTGYGGGIENKRILLDLESRALPL
ncbi:methylated-DNA--[protein]-cysteine S-methyltransferase [bacterium]|nr:MAG: methylated-DNA--[protein]-cysteine S-methyltransferase [bacterium]